MNYVKGMYYEEIEKPDLTKKIKKDKPKETKTENSFGIGMNFDMFNEVSIPLDMSSTTESKPKRSSKKAVDTTGLVTVESDTKYSQTEPYMNKYQETNALLKTAITQIDIGLGEMQQDLSLLRNNKTLRNKYQSMSMIQGNMGSFLGNKISAIKELNSVISKCNDLELKRAKELKEL